MQLIWSGVVLRTWKCVYDVKQYTLNFQSFFDLNHNFFPQKLNINVLLSPPTVVHEKSECHFLFLCFCCNLLQKLFISGIPTILSYCCSLGIEANEACFPVVVEGLTEAAVFSMISIYHAWQAAQRVQFLYCYTCFTVCCQRFVFFFFVYRASACDYTPFSSHFPLIKTGELLLWRVKSFRKLSIRENSQKAPIKRDIKASSHRHATIEFPIMGCRCLGPKQL